MLADGYVGRANSLNCLRLVFAAFVMVSHSFPLGGFGADPVVGDTSLGGIGVAGFFCISGFLITGSRARLSFGRYVTRRVFRIVPGYWAVLVVVGFGISALIAGSTVAWNFKSAIEYVVAGLALLVRQSSALNGVLSGLPYTGGINGSLWTLAPEFAFYLALGLIFGFGWIRNKYWLGFVVLVATGVYGQCFVPQVMFLPDVLSLLTFFLAGVSLWQAAPKVPLNIWLFGGAFILLLASFATGHFRFFGALPAAYCVLYAGVRLPSVFRRMGSKNDYSFGLYIYAFPVQQLLARLEVQEFGVWAFIAASAVCIAPFAAASWWLIEKPSQRLSLRLTRTPA